MSQLINVGPDIFFNVRGCDITMSMFVKSYCPYYFYDILYVVEDIKVNYHLVNIIAWRLFLL